MTRSQRFPVRQNEGRSLFVAFRDVRAGFSCFTGVWISSIFTMPYSRERECCAEMRNEIYYCAGESLALFCGTRKGGFPFCRLIFFVESTEGDGHIVGVTLRVG